MIDDATLAYMRSMQAKALPDTATIRRPTLSSDGRGGQTKTLTLIGTMPARLAMSKYQPGTREVGGREAPSAYATITLSYGTNVLPGDEITIGTRKFLVGSLLPGSWETARQVMCSEVL